MRNLSVLISGASIGGPAAAYWLHRYGCTVTVVEKSPTLRLGGQAIDFKGATHRTVLQRMGILDDVLARQTGGHDQTVVDAAGRPLAVIPGEFTGGEIEIARGDLSEILYQHTKNDCEYVFGDSITSLTETASGVHVTFEKGAPRTVDLVIGADGIHSNVRRLAFGPESDYVHFMGHYYALADINLPGDGLMYNEPGRMLAIGGPKASAFFVFGSPELTYDRYDGEQMKQIVSAAYEGGGWRTDEVLRRLPDAGEFTLDSISRVAVDRYARGRIVLLGDAAYGNTLGGFGTGLAIVGGYVLAGELEAADGDHHTAFDRYEKIFRPYAKISKSGNAGPFMAPPTDAAIRRRNLTFRSGLLLKAMLKITDLFATRIKLPDYPRPADRSETATRVS
ncbi:FAD-dependent monooxygenase [Microlunatus soli]|uniref:2-polyprenyl-6-methoxyphenol hydroxylase n=1 Tax=Microlunatus soli TaxID=630515 RepID=A0A1H1RBH4_9ACTN|nr:FAD-dependent monooxygenase [Microlunatus soli]SDS32269.1 2-polyprenyl-6-methoxyphenol hydroxylase [Microlunatus soli]